MTSIFEGQPPKNKAFSKQNKVHLGSRYRKPFLTALAPMGSFHEGKVMPPKGPYKTWVFCTPKNKGLKTPKSMPFVHRVWKHYIFSPSILVGKHHDFWKHPHRGLHFRYPEMVWSYQFHTNRFSTKKIAAGNRPATASSAIPWHGNR